MTKGRLETFTDGLIAIIMTIMVLELHAPAEATPAALLPLTPVFVSYVLSFAALAVYWNNHHQFLHGVTRVNGSVLWANLHLVFWLSLIPFVTSWMGEHSFAPFPVFAYGVIQTGAGAAFFLWQSRLVAVNPDSALARAVEHDRKGLLSMGGWIAGIAIALFVPIVALLIYALVVGAWLIPDRRVERVGV